MWWAPLLWLLVKIVEPIADQVIVGVLKKKVPNLPPESAAQVPALVNGVIDHLAGAAAPSSALKDIHAAVSTVARLDPMPNPPAGPVGDV
jgi:hypothetical protein